MPTNWLIFHFGGLSVNLGIEGLLIGFRSNEVFYDFVSSVDDSRAKFNWTIYIYKFLFKKKVIYSCNFSIEIITVHNVTFIICFYWSYRCEHGTLARS